MIEWIRESNLIEGVDDSKEDARSYVAWADLQTRSLGVDTILRLHQDIMCVLRPDISGKFRNCDVSVGNYRCPIWQEVEPRLREWVLIYRSYPVLSPEDIRASHVAFEKIHPFEDGNGRVGRMLMNWLRVSRGLEPLLIKANERHKYYEWFR